MADYFVIAATAADAAAAVAAIQMCMEAYVAEVKRNSSYIYIYDYVAVAIVVSDFSSPIVIIKM